MAMATGEGRRGRRLRSPGQSLCLRLRLMPSPGMATTDTEDTEATTGPMAMATGEGRRGVRKEFYNKKQKYSRILALSQSRDPVHCQL